MTFSIGKKLTKKIDFFSLYVRQERSDNWSNSVNVDSAVALFGVEQFHDQKCRPIAFRAVTLRPVDLRLVHIIDSSFIRNILL